MGMRRHDAPWQRRRRLLQAAAMASLPWPIRAAPARPRVVIAGGGFAGASCAMALRRLDASIDVILVDPIADYVTCPMSNAVLAGWRTMASVTFSRAGLVRNGVRCIRDRVVAIDASRKTARLGDGSVLDYDRMVVAPGIRFLPDSPEGYDADTELTMPHAWHGGQQTELLAAQLRAMDEGDVVAISIPSGLMRCPPGPFERASVMAAWLRAHKPRSKVLIFDANNHFPRQDAFTAAWKELYPGTIEWIPATEGGAVERVDAKNKTLYTSRGAQRVAVANIIPRQAPGQLAVDAGLASGHGWCPVDPTTFESKNVSWLHVIGDSCIAGEMPKAASAAHSQALHCARAIVAMLKGRELPPLEFDSVCYGLLARDRALSIHGRFAIEDGEIKSLAPPLPTRQPSATEEQDHAERWYREIVAESFGA